MPEISDKLAAFLQGGGVGLTILGALFQFLKWWGERKDKRASEEAQYDHDELTDTRRRADAFGDEMYERWQKCQQCADAWKDAYTDLYYTGQGLVPFLNQIPAGAMNVVQKIIDARAPRKVVEPEEKPNDG